MLKTNCHVYKVYKNSESTFDSAPFFERKTDKPREKFPAGRRNTRIVAFPTRSVRTAKISSPSIDILLRDLEEPLEKKRAISSPLSQPKKGKKEKPVERREKDPYQESFARDLAIYASGHACFSFLLQQEEEERGGKGWRGRMRRLEQKVFPV